MIISRTPYRISFFGGGTDYPVWYRKHGGAVLSATIDKYCYLSCRYLPPFFEHRIRVVYSKIETCQKVSEVAHPAVREVLTYLNVERGIEIHHDGDLPARSGMGSSSAFTVGLLHALHGLHGRMPSKDQLAQESICIEQDRLREKVGSQDQVQAAYGGLNYITFGNNGRISVKPMTLKPERIEELNAHLMLFYTGIQRTASEVADTYVNDMEARKEELSLLRDMVDRGVDLLGGSKNIRQFGELLAETWTIKKRFSQRVTNSRIDEIYLEAVNAGAIGGKLMGAGGGGFMMLFVPPSKQAEVRAGLKNLICVPFEFEFSGSQIIFFDLEKDYSAEDRARAGQPAPVFRELKQQED